MADPIFPFSIGRRDGRLTRPIMCRRCARWTAYDGESWRHDDGTEACIQPDELHNREAPMNDTQVKIPKHLDEACALIPPRTAEERCALIRAAKEAYAFYQEHDVKPDLIDLFQTWTATTQPESRTVMSATTTKTKATAVRGPKPNLIFALNGKPVRSNVNTLGELSWSGTKNIVDGKTRIKPVELEAILTEQFKITNARSSAWGPVTLVNGVTMQSCAVDEKGQPVGLVATAPVEKPARSFVRLSTRRIRSAAKPSKAVSAEGNGKAKPRAERPSERVMRELDEAETAKPLKRTKVTPIPKAKTTKKAKAS